MTSASSIPPSSERPHLRRASVKLLCTPCGVIRATGSRPRSRWRTRWRPLSRPHLRPRSPSGARVSLPITFARGRQQRFMRRPKSRQRRRSPRSSRPRLRSFRSLRTPLEDAHASYRSSWRAFFSRGSRSRGSALSCRAPSRPLSSRRARTSPRLRCPQWLRCPSPQRSSPYPSGRRSPSPRPRIQRAVDRTERRADRVARNPLQRATRAASPFVSTRTA